MVMAVMSQIIEIVSSLTGNHSTWFRPDGQSARLNILASDMIKRMPMQPVNDEFPTKDDCNMHALVI